MARKLCIVCNTRTAQTGQGAGVEQSDYNDQCNYCFTEGGWENSHDDHNHAEHPVKGCWICEPEANLAQKPHVKGTRKGHRSPRRPQINHRACNHPQNPKARRECRKAHWAAVAAGTAEGQAPQVATAKAVEAPVLHAAYAGLVEWDGRKAGTTYRGTIIRDLGAGKLLVRSTKGTPVRVAFSALRIAN